MINRLIDIINNETKNFERFLNLLEKQQSLIEKNQMDELLLLTDQQKELMINSKLLYEKRIKLVNLMKQDENYNSDNELKRLTDTVEQSQANRLLVLQKLLVKINNDISKTRDKNNRLLQRSREYIFKTIKILSNMNNLELNQSITDAICKAEGYSETDQDNSQKELSVV